jgi:hypothetical protein
MVYGFWAWTYVIPALVALFFLKLAFRQTRAVTGCTPSTPLSSEFVLFYRLQITLCTGRWTYTKSLIS